MLRHSHGTSHRPLSPATLAGPPKAGGFGLLPLQAHTRARHAAHALRLTSAMLHPSPSPPPWILLATHLLSHICPSLPPLQTLLLTTFATATDIAQGILGFDGLPQPHAIPSGPLSLMSQALQALGPPSSPRLDPSRLRSYLLTPNHPELAHILPTLSWQNPLPESPPTAPGGGLAGGPAAGFIYSFKIKNHTNNGALTKRLLGAGGGGASASAGPDAGLEM